METKWYVPPFVTYGKTKKPILTVPKGTTKAGHSKDDRISIWSYMGSSVVFILDTCYGETTELLVHRDKETVERKSIGDCPKALNEFNNKKFGVDCWDLVLHQNMENTPSRCMDVMGSGSFGLVTIW
eukprot:11287294-Ditylum_brightwellii.AAC.1